MNNIILPAVEFFTESAGACEGGSSPGNFGGFTHYLDRECPARCLASMDCTGYTMPVEDQRNANWCDTHTSLGIVGNGKTDFICYSKEIGLTNKSNVLNLIYLTYQMYLKLFCEVIVY